MVDPLESLYDGLEYGKETLLKHFDKSPADSDGQPVDVFVTAMPARFYTIKAYASKNSCGDEVAPFELATGSGDKMKELALAIAQAASEGMIGLHTEGEAIP